MKPIQFPWAKIALIKQAEANPDYVRGIIKENPEYLVKTIIERVDKALLWLEKAVQDGAKMYETEKNYLNFLNLLNPNYIPTEKPDNQLSEEEIEQVFKLLSTPNTKMDNFNIWIDPEIFSMGLELSVAHNERGSYKFSNYAAKMINDLGNIIRPRLKQFYNAVKDDPYYCIFEPMMDNYETVNAFDIMSFDPNSVGPHYEIVTQFNQQNACNTTTLSNLIDEKKENNKKIYYCKSLPMLTTMELERQPEELTEDLLEMEIQRLVEKAVKEGENPVHQAQDQIYLADFPTMPSALTPTLMQTDEIYHILREVKGEQMSIADKDLIEEYENKTFYSFLIELMNWEESR